jgi:ankyrin repeat protein
VTAPADDGRTPLHVATESGNVDVIRVLVEHRTARTDTTTARITQRRRFTYYVLIFCFFLAGGIYLQFMMWTYQNKQM